jgi:hypothetical protein
MSRREPVKRILVKVTDEVRKQAEATLRKWQILHHEMVLDQRLSGRRLIDCWYKQPERQRLQSELEYMRGAGMINDYNLIDGTIS